MIGVEYCTRCLMPSSRPRIQFRSDGVCNGCVTAERRLEIDYDERRNELIGITSKIQLQNNDYDCVVAWSGGKDSSAIALHLKEDFGLRPLLVTFSPLIPTEVGEANRAALIELGFDSIMYRPSSSISRRLARRFFIERGDPKVHWNAGISSVPIRAAVSMRIPLVFYAEHGESEYGGYLLSPEHAKERFLDEVLENHVGDDPINWVGEGISERDLYAYTYPSEQEMQESHVRALYFGYFYNWDVTENYKFVNNHFAFRGNDRGRTYGTFNDYDSVDDVMDDLYYYMQYIKFGFGRALRDSSRMIQRGKLTLSEAYDNISRFDGEFPEETIPQVLEYLDLTRTQFESIVDLHRPDWIWQHDKNGGWALRYPIPNKK